MRNHFKLVIATTLLASCEKVLDSPPIRTLPVGQVLTISQLRGLFTGAARTFSGDTSVYAVVTADEENGNLYKNVYVQDHTGAIVLRLLNSGGLYQGDSIRIYLPGTILGEYNELLQLDNVDVDNNIVKQSTGVVKQPQLVTVAEVTPELQGHLIRLDGVEFSANDVGLPFADVVNQGPANRVLGDCSANVIIRSSPYADFAAQATPSGNGSLIAVVGQFGADMQLFIRDINEVHLNGPRCGGALPIISNNFNDGSVTTGGWSTWSDNNIPWTTNTVGSYDNTAYGQCRNFIGGTNVPGESWLISPAVDLTTSTNPGLSFLSACNYTGPNLEVLVSTDFVSGSPTTGTWTTLPATLSSGSWAWTPSGTIPLSGFLAPNVRIAFRYTGTSTNGKTWELDNVAIAEN